EGGGSARRTRSRTSRSAPPVTARLLIGPGPFGPIRAAPGSSSALALPMIDSRLSHTNEGRVVGRAAPRRQPSLAGRSIVAEEDVDRRIHRSVRQERPGEAREQPPPPEASREP